MSQVLLRAFLVISGLFLAISPALAESRFALVIGNNSYRNLDASRQLQKAVNDADAVGAVLRRIGFKVTVGHDLDRDAIVDRLSDLSSQLHEGDTVFFFFAGHGLALDGSNYILPADVPDIQPGEEVRIKNRSISEAEIVSAVKDRGARVAILVLDACRDNPFRKGGTRSAGQERGLARMPPITGVFSLYSAGFGQTALDRLSDSDPDPNSVFTRVLLPQLNKPGLELTRMALDVRKQVFALAATTPDRHAQFPAFYNELLDEVYLAGQVDPDNTDRAASASSDEVVKATAACDRLAADPRDASRPAAISGVLLENIDAGAAIRTCSAAVQLDAQNARLLQSLGRAYVAAKRLEEAHATFLRAAELGSSLGKLEVGQDFEQGRGVTPDPMQAIAWFRKSAVAGNGEGMRRLALGLDYGEGISANPVEALDWYHKAAETGDADAQLDYAVALELAKGQDAGKALAWYRKAAEGGNKWAMQRLADALSTGLGVARNDAEAATWYGKAAGLGLPQAMTGLAGLLISGRGVEKNEAAAIDWYRQAAGMGDAYATAQLARHLAVTRGLPDDSRQAQPLLLKLAELLDPSVKNASLSSDAVRGLGRVERLPLGQYRKQADLLTVLTQSAAQARLDTTSLATISAPEMEKTRADFAKVSGEAIRLTMQSSKLQQDLASKALEADQAQAEVARLRSQTVEAEGLLKSARDELESLKGVRGQSDEAIAARDVQITNLRTEINRLAVALSTSRNTLDEVRQQVASLTAEAQTKAQIAEAQAQALAQARTAEAQAQALAQAQAQALAQARAAETQVRPAGSDSACVGGRDRNGYVWAFYGDKTVGSQAWNYRWFDALSSPVEGAGFANVEAEPIPGMVIRPRDSNRSLRCSYPIYVDGKSTLAESVPQTISAESTYAIQAVMRTEKNSFWIGFKP